MWAGKVVRANCIRPLAALGGYVPLLSRGFRQIPLLQEQLEIDVPAPP
jgi:hypothetical protein